MIEYLLVFGLLVFWMIPWAVCHGYAGWWLYKNGTARGGYAAMIGMLFVFGAIPFVNFFLMVNMFVRPLYWYERIRGRR